MRLRFAIELASLLIVSVNASAQVADKERGLSPIAPGNRTFDRGQKWAVIIGCDRYLDPSIPRLTCAVADARLMARTLTGTCGYDPKNVLSITEDATEPHLLPLGINLRNQVREWLKKVRNEDTVIVFFAGHGFIDDRGQGILAPQDVERDRIGLTGLRINDLRDMLHQCGAAQKLLILDCCHAGSERGDPLKEIPAPTEAQLRPAFARAKGLITLASCGKDERSQEWKARGQGLFTYFLARGLTGEADGDNDGVVTSDELYLYVFDFVSTTAQKELNARQTPVRIIGEGVVGTFALARGGAARHTDPRLFLLSVGISLYAKETLKGLRTARTDAIAFADMMRRQEGIVYAKVERRVLTDAEATRVKVEEAIDWLRTSAMPNDQAILFYTGHAIRGSRATRGEQSVDLYLATFDSDPEHPGSTSVPFARVRNALRQMPCRPLALLNLTDEGGKEVMPGGVELANDSVGALLGERSEGRREAEFLLIVASGRETDPSEKRDDKGPKGVFTHHLLSALEDSATDKDGDGIITLAELEIRLISALRGSNVQVAAHSTPASAEFEIAGTGRQTGRKIRTLDQVLAETSTAIADAITAHGHNQVDVGRIAGPRGAFLSGAVGLRMRFVEELQGRGIKHHQGAELGLRVEVRPRTLGTHGSLRGILPAVALTPTLEDREGRKLVIRGSSGPSLVTSASDVAMLVGVSVELPATKSWASLKLNAALGEPARSTANVNGTSIQPAAGSKFGVEIVKVAPGEKEFPPLRPDRRDGVPVVGLREGDSFAIKLKNDNDFEVGVQVSVDGLDTLMLSTREKQSGRFWILQPHQIAMIKGWPLTDNRIALFRVGEFPNSIAGASVGREKQGSVCVSFHELKTPRAGIGAAPGPVERELGSSESPSLGELRSAVTVRYSRDDGDRPAND
jgi:uncharacterized caspase-like protein